MMCKIWRMMSWGCFTASDPETFVTWTWLPLAGGYC